MKVTEDPRTPFNERKWFGWTRWTWVRLAFGFLVIMGALGFYLTQRNYDADKKRALQNQYDLCVSGNNVRQTLRDVIVFSYASGGGLDITAIPSFAALDKPTQVYLMDLNTVLNSGVSDKEKQKRIEATLSKVPLRDCDTEYPDQVTQG